MGSFFQPVIWPSLRPFENGPDLFPGHAVSISVPAQDGTARVNCLVA
jgi:archaellum component FlaF (FlaF/FlaG flagellin family)